MRLAIEVCYEGTAYFGWQIQAKQISVQQVIEEKIQQLCGRLISVTGCGRTDTGVHASQYFLHLDLQEEELEHLTVYKLNAVLPVDIAVKNISKVHDQFHARYDANYRKYIYRIHNAKNPFIRNHSFYYHSIQTSSLNSLNEVATIIQQTKDFSSFCKSKSGLKNFECTIYKSRWIQISENEFEFHIAANRFVRGMVRLCVGACLSYYNHKTSLESIQASIQNKIQLDHSWSVPAHGLTLVEVKYPEVK